LIAAAAADISAAARSTASERATSSASDRGGGSETADTSTLLIDAGLGGPHPTLKAIINSGASRAIRTCRGNNAPLEAKPTAERPSRRAR